MLVYTNGYKVHLMQNYLNLQREGRRCRRYLREEVTSAPGWCGATVATAPSRTTEEKRPRAPRLGAQQHGRDGTIARGLTHACSLELACRSWLSIQTLQKLQVGDPGAGGENLRVQHNSIADGALGQTPNTVEETLQNSPGEKGVIKTQKRT